VVTSITLHGDEQTISAYIPCRTDAPERMRRLLILGVLAVVPGPANAKPPAIQCPGENTVEMRYCAEQSWEQSDAQLRQKVGKGLMEQWHEATKALCSAAYAPYKDGTIYPQLVVGCDDRLNRALLEEFRGMGEQ
jgi:hypothetical protein